jgi:NADP-dependent 3-hydroxy acid dehydrogenase YdfG
MPERGGAHRRGPRTLDRSRLDRSADHRDPPLAGSVAVITGAGGGVGGAIARAFAQHGATLCLIGRRVEALQAVVRTARPRGQPTLRYVADVGRAADVDSVVDRISRDVGRVDFLVHSAGVIALGGVEEATLEDLDRQYDTNIRGPYLLTKRLLPFLKTRRGQVVFINSTAGLVARAGVSQYAATKHGLRALAESLREEVNPSGVRVLSVFLGRTATAMQVAVHAAEGRPYEPERLVQPEDVAAIVLSALSLPRTAEVTEIRIRPMQP